METRRLILGVFVWLLAAGAGYLAVTRQLATVDSSIGEMQSGMTQWITGQQTKIAVIAKKPVALAVGDPVFLKQEDGTYRQVGRVRSNSGAPITTHLTKAATLEVYDSALSSFRDGYEIRYYGAPITLDWVAKTMLPPEKQKLIAQTIADDWKLHQNEIIEKLTPLVEQSVQRSVSIVEAELPRSIERHRADFTKLGDRYKSEIVREQMIPLAQERILPIIQEEVRPLAGDIGRELWNRVSLWSFTWRYLYDASPLPERNVLKQEFDRFLEVEAMPLLEAKTPEFVAVTEKIMNRLSRDPVVNETMRKNFRNVASDPELHRIVWDVIEESIVRNVELREALRAEWKRPEVQQTIEVMSTRFEPTARKIGDLIVGSREKGVTPEFARILRVQILVKDRRWLILHPKERQPSELAQPDRSQQAPGQTQAQKDASQVPQTLVEATDVMPFPLVFEGSQQSPLSKIQ
ncbi:MAG: hypothetical protein JNL58_24640 [Planctomyces sp.]|nr:hypothetical protein [Planctomyces sp.]